MKNKQLQLFESSRIFQQMSKKIFDILGLNASTKYIAKIVVAMWYQCTFYQSTNFDKLAPWCSVNIKLFNKPRLYIYNNKKICLGVQ